MSTIASRTFARTTRSALRQSRAPLSSSRLAQQQLFRSSQSFPQATSSQSVRTFSANMAVKSDAQAAPAPPQEFDKEIVDMADYATNYRVTSDLAVRERDRIWDTRRANGVGRLIRPASSSSTRSAAVSKPSSSRTAPNCLAQLCQALPFQMAPVYQVHRTSLTQFWVPSTLER